MRGMDMGAGLAKASDYFANREERTRKATTAITNALVDEHGEAFLAYLEAYGMDAYEYAIQAQYESRVLAQWGGLTDETFKQWVTDQFKAQDLLAPPRLTERVPYPFNRGARRVVDLPDREDSSGTYAYYIG